MPKRVTIAVLVSPMLAAAPALSPAPALSAERAPRAAGLKAFGSCKSLLRYARRNALRRLEPELFSPAPQPLPRLPAPLPVQDGPAPQAGAPVSEEFSGTNVQEAGVDEPDSVKTDGAHIFASAGGKLHAIDVRSAAPRKVGTLALGSAGDAELLLRGDRLLVLSRAFSPGSVPPFAVRPASVVPSLPSRTVLTEVDVSRPEAMRILRTLTVKGDPVSARLTGGTARVVISTSPPALELGAPAQPGLDALRQTRRRNRAALRRSRLSRWLPSYRLRDRRARRTATRRMVRCRAVRRASVFAGLDMLTVLTIDLDKGLPPVDSDALMTDADTVYGSPDSLYVATPRWRDPDLSPERQGRGMITQVHRFAATSPTETVYRASGKVRGFLLNQFSLSEHRGRLRVASTSEPASSGGGRDGESESFVTVLSERGTRLARVGRVGGLGRGERIYSVRFIGDAGYVVTFRQVDPLYTIDLSQPTAPRVRGELKIRGYSAYLHPAGDGLLIGVGQDATTTGRELGTQLSLFDVSDLANPRRLHQRTVAPDASSAAEFDHHAFLWWAPTKLAVLPVEIYGRDGTYRSAFTGAIGFRIGRDSGIAEAGRIAHGTGERVRAIDRSIVVGRRLYTISSAGVGVNSLATLGGLGFVPFE